MAWDIKYKLEFMDINSGRWKVTIEDETAHVGNPVEMQGTSTPLQISFLSNGEDIYRNIINGSTAQINAYSNTNFQWADLYGYDNKKFKINVFCTGSTGNTETLFWSGFVNSEGYSEPYDGISYPVVISATDGLGQLKTINYKYTTVTEDDTFFNGRQLASQIIFDILSKIQITGFTEYVNIYCTGMTATTDSSVFDQLYINTDVFRDLYCYDVLENILKVLNASIRQVNGQICIYRPTELINETVYGRIFASPTGKTSTTLSTSQYFDNVNSHSNIRYVNGGNLNVQQPIKKVVVNQDYGYKTSWLDNYLFKDTTFNGYNFDSWTNSAGATCAPISTKMPSEKEGVILLGVDDTKYIYQYFGTNCIPEASPAIYNFEFDYQLYNGNGEKTMNTAEKLFMVYNAETGKYLYEVDGTYAAWTSTLSYIYIPAYGTINPGGNGWNTYKRRIVGQPAYGSIEIRSYARNAGLGVVLWTAVKNIRYYTSSDTIVLSKVKRKLLQRIASANGGHIYLRPKYYYVYSDVKDNEEIVEKQYTKENNIKGQIVDLDYILGDVCNTNIGNSLVQFSGLLTTLSGATYIPTDNWKTRNGNENKPLLQIIGDEIASQYNRPKQLLSLPVMQFSSNSSLNVLGNFQDIYNLYNSLYRIFIFNSGVLDVKNVEWQADFNEVVFAPASTPTPSPTPTRTITPTPSKTPSPTPTPTVTSTSVSPTPTPSLTHTITPTPTPTQTSFYYAVDGFVCNYPTCGGYSGSFTIENNQPLTLEKYYIYDASTIIYISATSIGGDVPTTINSSPYYENCSTACASSQ